VKQDIYLNLESVLKDLGLPMSQNVEFEAETAVTISGRYRPSTRFDPEEFPEAEAQKQDWELAEDCLVYYLRGLPADDLHDLNQDQLTFLLAELTLIFHSLLREAETKALEE